MCAQISFFRIRAPSNATRVSQLLQTAKQQLLGKKEQVSREFSPNFVDLFRKWTDINSRITIYLLPPNLDYVNFIWN